jgi:hypothetical protein
MKHSPDVWRVLFRLPVNLVKQALESNAGKKLIDHFNPHVNLAGRYSPGIQKSFQERSSRIGSIELRKRRSNEQQTLQTVTF